MLNVSQAKNQGMFFCIVDLLYAGAGMRDAGCSLVAARPPQTPPRLFLFLFLFPRLDSPITTTFSFSFSFSFFS